MPTFANLRPPVSRKRALVQAVIVGATAVLAWTYVPLPGGLVILVSPPVGLIVGYAMYRWMLTRPAAGTDLPVPMGLWPASVTIEADRLEFLLPPSPRLKGREQPIPLRVDFSRIVDPKHPPTGSFAGVGWGASPEGRRIGEEYNAKHPEIAALYRSDPKRARKLLAKLRASGEVPAVPLQDQSLVIGVSLENYSRIWAAVNAWRKDHPPPLRSDPTPAGGTTAPPLR